MRVLKVGPSSEAKGGIATVIKNFKKYSKFNDITLEYYESWKEGGRGFRFYNSIISLFKFIFVNNSGDKKIDILHLHVAQKGSFFRKSLYAVIAKKKNIKVIMHMHASQFDVFFEESNNLLKKIIINVFNHVDLIIALDKSWEKFYSELSITRVEVLNNAVKTPSNFDYNTMSHKVIALGRLGKRKGTYDILKIAKDIQRVNPNIVFELYGDGEIEEVQRLIEAEDITNCKIGGWIDSSNKEKIFSDAALHILPSYHEGMPMAILETMSYGIPNISTNVGGISEVVKSDFNGVLIEAGDTGTLKDKILDLMKNPAKRSEMSENSIKTIKSDFSLENYFDHMEKIYKELRGSE